MIDHSDPTGCQSAAGWSKFGYIDIADVNRRIKLGQSQALCAVCQRWRWGDRRCKDFVRLEEKS